MARDFSMDEKQQKLTLHQIREFLASAPETLTPDLEWCLFCGQQPGDVAGMVRGPVASICSECVALCVEILTEKGEWHG